MSKNIAEEQKNGVEAGAEVPEKVVSEQDQEKALTEKAEGAMSEAQEALNALKEMMNGIIADAGGEEKLNADDREAVKQMRGQMAEIVEELSETPVDLRQLGEVSEKMYPWHTDQLRTSGKEIVTVDGQEYTLTGKIRYDGKDEVSQDYSHVKLADGSIAVKGFEVKDRTGVREKFTQSFDQNGRIISSERFVRDDRDGDYTVTETMKYDDEGNLIQQDTVAKALSKGPDGTEMNYISRKIKGEDGRFVSRQEGETRSFIQSAEEVEDDLSEEKNTGGRARSTVVYGDRNVRHWDREIKG